MGEHDQLQPTRWRAHILEQDPNSARWFARSPDAEWVWWMDVDIIIMNISLGIHDHVLSQEGMARNILLDYPMTGAVRDWVPQADSISAPRHQPCHLDGA